MESAGLSRERTASLSEEEDAKRGERLKRNDLRFRGPGPRHPTDCPEPGSGAHGWSAHHQGQGRVKKKGNEGRDRTASGRSPGASGGENRGQKRWRTGPAPRQDWTTSPQRLPHWLWLELGLAMPTV